MRVLVTGAHGFVGRHMVHDLTRAGHTPLQLDHVPDPRSGAATTYTCDLRDADKLKKIVAEIRPDACIHLAGIAFVPMGWTDPELVFSVNLFGVVNLLEAFHAGSPATRILVVTSSEVYGRKPSPVPLTEETPLAADNLYAVSKSAADLSALLYARRYGMHIMTARPQNHIGPGQSPQFVTSAFAAQLVEIASKHAPPRIRVGNLECERDFSDVRDVARAYRLLIEKGRAGEAYNIGSGRAVKIRKVLDLLCALAGVAPTVEIDPARYRPQDDPPILDIRKIHEHTGWKPEIPLTRTLEDIYADIKRQQTATSS